MISAQEANDFSNASGPDCLRRTLAQIEEKIIAATKENKFFVHIVAKEIPYLEANPTLICDLLVKAGYKTKHLIQYFNSPFQQNLYEISWERSE